jgi:hypothetical protein
LVVGSLLIMGGIGVVNLRWGAPSAVAPGEACQLSLCSNTAILHVASITEEGASQWKSVPEKHLNWVKS